MVFAPQQALPSSSKRVQPHGERTGPLRTLAKFGAIWYSRARETPYADAATGKTDNGVLGTHTPESVKQGVPTARACGVRQLGRRGWGRVSTVESPSGPADLEEPVLVLVVRLSPIALRAPARRSASAFSAVQGTRDRRAPTRALGAASADRSASTDSGGPRSSCGSEPVVATVELAVLLRHADNAAPLASAARRQALDLWRQHR
jgi:hypothetical protein